MAAAVATSILGSYSRNSGVETLLSAACRLFGKALLVVAVVVAMTEGANSVAMVHQIDIPLPAEFHGRAIGLLRKVRPSDTEEALRNTKARWWSTDVEGESVIVMRVEAGCHLDRCMTLIGRMTEDQIDLGLTLEVGRAFLAMDASYPLWNSRTAAPLIFEIGDGAGIVAVLREQGWVVAGCVKCTDWGARNNEQAAQPPVGSKLELKKEDFEDFRRALGRN